MNVQELLDDLKIPIRTSNDHKNVRHGWVGIDCPWCGLGSNKYHLGINLQNGQSTCWQCGFHSLASVLVELGGISFKEAFSLLDNADLRRGWKPREQHTGTYKPPSGLGPLKTAHRRYLRARGFDPDQLAKLWGIGSTGFVGALRWRIFIPITYRGEAVSWTTRGIVEGAGYVSAKSHEEAIPHKSLLLGEDYVGSAVVVTEGPMDAFRIGHGAVATFGVRVTAEQVYRISRIPYRYILFDNEPEAQKRARKLADQLSIFPGQTTVLEIDADDPGSASPREIRQVRRVAFHER